MAAQLDPYVTDERGQRINTTVWDVRGAPFRFVNADLRLNTSMTVGRVREMIKGKPRETAQEPEPSQTRQQEVKEEDLLSLFENFGINHNIAFDIRPDTSGKVSFKVLTNSVNAQGNIKLTANWGISVGNFGYDFQRKGLSFPSFGFTRDLHCWNMAFNWQPTRGTYSFFIAVKPGSLDFLNIPYQRNNADTLRAFQ